MVPDKKPIDGIDRRHYLRKIHFPPRKQFDQPDFYGIMRVFIHSCAYVA